MSAGFEDRWFRSHDGLRLYYRDYGGAGEAAPVVCLPGLTRNSKDFAGIAAEIAPNRRVLAFDLRGRGRSAHDPNRANYNPAVEMRDVLGALDEAGIARFVLLGTSRGGIIAMMMAAMAPGRMAVAILNDVGPELAAPGLARIMGYVGRTETPSGWAEAAALMRRMNEDCFHGVSAAEWMAWARQTFDEVDGRPAPNYDRHIGTAMRESAEALAKSGEPPPDMWPLFHAMKAIPTLLVQGETSDLLTDEIVAKMRAAKPDLELVVAKGRGHPPFLNEANVKAAIHDFLSRVA